MSLFQQILFFIFDFSIFAIAQENIRKCETQIHQKQQFWQLNKVGTFSKSRLVRI